MIRPNRTKIVATVGPKTRDPVEIAKLLRAGVNVVRLNAAHCEPDQIRADVATIRRVAAELDHNVGILIDLQGPKIRVGSLKGAMPIYLNQGAELIISCDPTVIGEVGTNRIGTPNTVLANYVRPRQRILLDDGMIELRVLGVDGPEIRTEVVYGGLLKQHKGINLPDSKLEMECLSSKDRADLEVALEAEVDYVAISFVRCAGDVIELKQLIKAANGDARVIAKIERPEAVEALDEILAASDGLMIARGDMGVELGPEEVPGIQKRIIRAAVAARKPVITATQMLESMIASPRPTRAEASDVANAIYDGTSAVMLSAETASGQYPILAVEIMERIIRTAEKNLFAQEGSNHNWGQALGEASVTMATVRAAAYAALASAAKLIAVYTESGTTAQMLADERVGTRVIAFTPYQRSVQRLSLLWGIEAHLLHHANSVRDMVNEGERILLDQGLIEEKQDYVVVVGTSRRSGFANIMKIRRAGDPVEEPADRGG